MRIIRALVALGALAAVLFPLASFAQAQDGSSDTKTEFKINNQVILDNGVVRHKYSIEALGGPYNFEGYMPVKSSEEIAREAKLLRWETERRNARFPEGKFVINASAYTAAADECGKSDGITASGLKVKEHETIACPPQFPLGTKLNIEGMGTYVCQDRGGAIKGNHVDIYVETKSEAFGFGRRNLLAEVVM
jgi:3D (Asp-Asp-Asp) domain-containing protein